MRCEVCGGEEACVHLTQLMNGQVKKAHLCKACAAKSGINIDDPVSLADLLATLEPEGGGTPAAPDPRCGQCHMRLHEFRKSSRLGCPACYDAFAAALAPLIEGLHKASLHAGKKPAGVRLARESRDRAAALSVRLKAAIASEKFEEAARLRDELKRVREEA